MTGNHRHINQPHTLRRRDYLGPYLFTDNEFDRYETAEGYITPNDVYHAYIPDYQGNIVGVVNTSSGILEQATDYYPYGLPFADASNPTANRRKYGAKELTPDLGLNAYDFEARTLSPAFLQPDPLTESYYPLSPYLYCAGNPINLVDPTGMDWVEQTNGNIYWRKSVTESNYQNILKKGETYRGKDYVRYATWDNTRAKGLVQEHYKSDQVLYYEIHDGTFQLDFEGEVVTSQKLTGRRLNSQKNAAYGIEGTLYLNAIFSDGGTYTKDKYSFTSGPYGNGPAPNHNYTGYKFEFTNQRGMLIYGETGWKVYIEDCNGRTELRLHPDTNSPGTAGCIGIQGTAEQLKALGEFFLNYLMNHKNGIKINFQIPNNPNYGNNGKANSNIGQ